MRAGKTAVPMQIEYCKMGGLVFTHFLYIYNRYNKYNKGGIHNDNKGKLNYAQRSQLELLQLSGLYKGIIVNV